MEAQRSKNFKEFYRILIGKQCNLVNTGKECYDKVLNEEFLKK
jgi:hypothetical protein